MNGHDDTWTADEFEQIALDRYGEDIIEATLHLQGVEIRDATPVYARRLREYVGGQRFR